MPRRFLGILREPVYSPGKVDDDRAILESVAAELAARHDVRVLNAADALAEHPGADVVFTMAQGPTALARLRQWQARGVRIINTPTAIEKCHRHRMMAAFARAQVRQPPTALVRTHAPAALPEWIADGVWVKRGDFHATQPDDVVYAEGAGRVSVALTDLDRRGIRTAIVQRHVPGTVIKFYAVRDRYFTWLGSEQDGSELPLATVEAVRALAEHGAAALGLEVFGGDCVLSPTGEPLLIDLNDWPSYGPCRLEAAHAIAQYVATPPR
jgi:hypothetical protein